MNLAKYSKVGWEDAPSKKTPVTANNLNHMDEQIKVVTDNVIEMSNLVPVKLTGVLSAGSTTLEFNNAAITGSCSFDLFTDEYGVTPKSAVAIPGSLSTVWEAQENDINVLLKIYKEV